MEECLECAECAENKRTLAAGYASCRAAISELGGELRGRIVTALLQGPEYGLAFPNSSPEHMRRAPSFCGIWRRCERQSSSPRISAGERCIII